MPFFRKCILKGARVFTYLMSGAKLTDPHNGFRLIKAETLSNITLTADTMAYASELIDQTMKQNFPH